MYVMRKLSIQEVVACEGLKDIYVWRQLVALGKKFGEQQRLQLVATGFLWQGASRQSELSMKDIGQRKTKIIWFHSSMESETNQPTPNP